ncbi:hypothetical protein HELRODRAFT_172818 [Helobdella robusta]|uniref:Uncharacterized protein n=1 Tax=Helobdella robusta TaxID=6412 RepID=T1F5Z0_HELRO|nr:hypothetical protein HELRODRAFT_172818 [Helobdella robusta]ESO04427.1 hypothetical protein HELRODRAFT_172818 [Helobdella robusta]
MYVDTEKEHTVDQKLTSDVPKYAFQLHAVEAEASIVFASCMYAYLGEEQSDEKEIIRNANKKGIEILSKHLEGMMSTYRPPLMWRNFISKTHLGYTYGYHFVTVALNSP